MNDSLTRQVTSLTAAVNRYAFGAPDKAVLDALDALVDFAYGLAGEADERLNALESESDDFSLSMDRTETMCEDLGLRLAALEAQVDDMLAREQEEKVDP